MPYQKRSHAFSPGAERLAATIACVILALTLVPLLIIGFYDRPSADDISYGWQTRQAFLQTGNLAETLTAAYHVTAETYKSWQGTFSAVFLFSLQPAIFKEEFYAVTPFIMLGMLVFSTLSMLRALLWEWRHVRITGSVMLFLSIQYLPSVAEGFFWYNGAVFYTFFYSAFLFCFSAQLRLCRAGEEAGPSLLFKILLYSIFSFLIGGGNYVTALLQVMLMVMVTALCFLLKKPARLKAAFCLFTLSSLSGLAVNLSAPGNAARQLHFSQPSIPSAILSCFKYAFYDALNWFTPAVFCLLILLIPLFYALASSSTSTFRFPLLVVIASFCIFAAQNMPPVYAMGYPGPGRLRDIIYFSYIWLIFGNAFYLTGWVSARLRLQIHPRERKIAAGKKVIALCTLLLCFWVVQDSVGVMTSWRCARDLLQGTAGQRLLEYNDRLRILNNPDIMHAKLSPFTAMPETIALRADYKASDEASLNLAGARYYSKKSIVLKSGNTPSAHTAYPNSPGISVNGKTVEMPLYLIDQGAANYACIHDIARVFTAGGKPFDIRHDDEAGTITLYPGQPYASAGHAPAIAMDAKKAVRTNTRFLINGLPADIRSYGIDGETFVRLNDIAQALDFYITYNRITDTVELDTGKEFALPSWQELSYNESIVLSLEVGNER